MVSSIISNTHWWHKSSWYCSFSSCHSVQMHLMISWFPSGFSLQGLHVMEWWPKPRGLVVKHHCSSQSECQALLATSPVNHIYYIWSFYKRKVNRWVHLYKASLPTLLHIHPGEFNTGGNLGLSVLLKDTYDWRQLGNRTTDFPIGRRLIYLLSHSRPQFKNALEKKMYDMVELTDYYEMNVSLMIRSVTPQTVGLQK